MPTVSIIVPAYNQADYLGFAIRSVLEQTFQDFEIIIIDDGSKDHTQQVVHNFVDPRIHYVYQDNRGLSAARNTGLRHATGSFISFLDSDDLFLANKLEILLPLLDEPSGKGFVAGQSHLIDEHGKYLNRLDGMNFPKEPAHLLFGNPIHVGSVLIKRSWMERIELFDESLRACEDWDMWLRLAIAGCPMTWIPEPVALYRVHTAQMTREAERMRTAMLRVLDKIYTRTDLPEGWLALKDRAYAEAYSTAAARAYHTDDYVSAAGDLVTAVQLDPSFSENKYQHLILKLVKWSDAPQSQNPEKYLDGIYQHAPDSLPGFRKELQRSIASAIVGSAFQTARNKERIERKSLLRAIWYEPSWLLNRGFLRILVDSWIHPVNSVVEK